MENSTSQHMGIRAGKPRSPLVPLGKKWG